MKQDWSMAPVGAIACLHRRSRPGGHCRPVSWFLVGWFNGYHREFTSSI